MDPAVGEGEAGAGGQVPGGARDEDVSGVPERHDASRLVDRHTTDASGDQFDLPDVDSGPDVEADDADRGADLEC
jgi:hypothetical protein